MNTRISILALTALAGVSILTATSASASWLPRQGGGSHMNGGGHVGVSHVGVSHVGVSHVGISHVGIGHHSGIYAPRHFGGHWGHFNHGGWSHVGGYRPGHGHWGHWTRFGGWNRGIYAGGTSHWYPRPVFHRPWVASRPIYRPVISYPSVVRYVRPSYQVAPTYVRPLVRYVAPTYQAQPVAAPCECEAPAPQVTYVRPAPVVVKLKQAAPAPCDCEAPATYEQPAPVVEQQAAPCDCEQPGQATAEAPMDRQMQKAPVSVAGFAQR